MYGQIGVSSPTGEGLSEHPNEGPESRQSGRAASEPVIKRWDEPCFADVELVVRRSTARQSAPDKSMSPEAGGDQGPYVFPVHSAVVSEASRPLRDQILSRRSRGQREFGGGGEAEGKSSLGPMTVITMNGDGVTAAALDILLDFMYTGRCDVRKSAAASSEVSSLEVATTRLAKGLGLGVVAALIRGRPPLWGQGLPLPLP